MCCNDEDFIEYLKNKFHEIEDEVWYQQRHSESVKCKMTFEQVKAQKNLMKEIIFKYNELHSGENKNANTAS